MQLRYPFLPPENEIRSFIFLVTQSTVWERGSHTSRILQGGEDKPLRTGSESPEFFVSFSMQICHISGLPRWRTGKEYACQCRRPKRPGFYPWVGKIPWRRTWQPIPVFLPGKFHGQRSLVGYSPWGCKESDTTEHKHPHTHIHTHTHTNTHTPTPTPTHTHTHTHTPISHLGNH